jgi:DNA-binding MarR family transcriptional regulator
VTVTCLADTMNTTKSNVTAMVDRLIAEGLVTRQQSVADRRTVVIALTEEGQRRYTEGVEVVRKFHAELSALFSTEERHLLDGIMAKLPQ